MNLKAEQLREFARTYVKVTSALIKEGVQKGEARDAARQFATDVLYEEAVNAGAIGGPCPLCGR